MNKPKKLLNNYFQSKVMELKLEDYPSIEESPETMEKVLKELEKNPLIKKITIYGKTIKSYPVSEVNKLRAYLNSFLASKLSIERALTLSKCKSSMDFSIAYKKPLEFLRLLYKETKKPSCSSTNYKNSIKEAFNSIAYSSLFKTSPDSHFKYTLNLNAYERSRITDTLFSSSKGKLVSEYKLEDSSEVRIYTENDIDYLYYLTPSEFLLSIDEEYLVIDVMKDVEKRVDLLVSEDPVKMAKEIIRQSLIKRIKSTPNVDTSSIKKLMYIALRNTVGYGVVDILLLDDEIQDIYINREEEAIYLRHNSYEEMMTNIFPTSSNISEWSTKIKLENNKPLDESHPLLDGNIFNEKAMVRVSLMHPPLNTEGISFSIRRHREVPITLPLLVKNGAIPAKAAAYLSIVALFGRSMLISGSRGSGKTTLLGALLFELPSKYRIVTIEDTLELPVNTLISNNYNVISMKSKSFLSISEYDIEAQNALKASLRFGDSCLILGEARGKETVALYEAMRVGALSNFVAGTLHAESPYGVYDRVVNDLGVKKTSFKATDVIVMLSLLKTPSNLRRERKLVSIVELRDDWEEDPLEENAFVSIAEHSSGSYSYSLNASVVLNKIAKSLPSKFSKKKLIEMIETKEKAIEHVVKLSKSKPYLLNPEYTIKINSLFLSSFSKKQPLKWLKQRIEEM